MHAPLVTLTRDRPDLDCTSPCERRGRGPYSGICDRGACHRQSRIVERISVIGVLPATEEAAGSLEALPCGLASETFPAVAGLLLLQTESGPPRIGYREETCRKIPSSVLSFSDLSRG
jgi:hypothetical protein